MNTDEFFLLDGVKDCINENMCNLIVLLNDLSSPDFLDLEYNEEKQKIVKDKFLNIYGDQKFRHSYSILDIFIWKIESEDEKEGLQIELSYILKLIDMNEFLSNEINLKVKKLYDHIQLSIIHSNRLSAINYRYKIINESCKNIETSNKDTLKQLNEAKNEFQILDDKVKGYHSQSIEILGIFSALILGFSTGIDIIKGSFDNISNLNFYKMMILCSFIGLVLFDVMFLLIYCISKVSNHSMRTNCQYHECAALF